MKTLRRAAFIMVVGAALAIPAAAAGATPSRNGPGQPGARNATCGSPNTALTLGVVPWQVADLADGWAADGSVVSASSGARPEVGE